MKIDNRFTRRSTIEFSSADPIYTLQQIYNAGIEVFRIVQTDDFTIHLAFNGTAVDQLIPIMKRYAESYRIIKQHIGFATITNMAHRPILLLGILIYVILVFFLPSRILFVQVKGNENIPTAKIISVATQCGIHFGSSRKLVRSEEMKNRMISQLPQLEWIGVNTYGCVAEISVRERISQSYNVTQPAIGSIVADRDGVILSCTTLKGTQICKPGQAVKQGQLLVSGYTDCGQFIQGTLAQAEILAETKREFTVLTPNQLQQRHGKTHEEQRFRLIIGNNLINFYKCSGILPTTCVKIYVEYPFVLPGGFRLPVSLVKERLLYYKSAAGETNLDWVSNSADDYLESQMVAGNIISKEIHVAKLENTSMYTAKYFCTEMIGQIKFEETLLAYGHDGKNSECGTR